MNGHLRARAGGEGPADDRRLMTWKEIAAFLGRDEKTARRWEAERGLPVYRAPGAGRSTVYATVRELEAWLRSGAQAATDAPASSPSERDPVDVAVTSRKTRVRPGAAAAVVATVLIGVTSVAVATRIAAPARPAASPEARALYLQGVREWSRRTPESLARAVDLFTQAVVRDPGDAAAYVGLADCYNLLREYTVLSPREAFPRAEAAARRALAIDPRRADAHAALAFVLGWWRWAPAEAEAEYARALALDPRDAEAWHWRATWRLARGQVAAALEDIEHAQALKPESDSIAADRGLILFSAGREAEAVSILQRLEAERPDFQSPHWHMQEIRMAQGRWSEWLDEMDAVARIRQEPERAAAAAAARAGLDRAGEPGMWRALIAEQERQLRAGQLSHLALAATYARAGRDRAALREVATAVADHDMDAVALPNGLAFRDLRNDRDFRLLERRTGAPV